MNLIPHRTGIELIYAQHFLGESRHASPLGAIERERRGRTANAHIALEMACIHEVFVFQRESYCSVRSRQYHRAGIRILEFLKRTAATQAGVDEMQDDPMRIQIADVHHDCLANSKRNTADAK